MASPTPSLAPRPPPPPPPPQSPKTLWSEWNEHRLAFVNVHQGGSLCPSVLLNFTHCCHEDHARFIASASRQTQKAETEQDGLDNINVCDSSNEEAGSVKLWGGLGFRLEG